jgi:hypothetical protein
MEQKSNGALISSIVIVVLLIVGGAYFLSNKAAPKQGEGRIVVGITDPAQNMGTVSSVVVTVNQVQLHSETQGWITVSSDTKQYDLVSLNQSNTVSLYADASVSAGTYNQVRLDIGKVVVTDSGVTHEAKLPSGMLKITGNFIVKEGETSSAVFDFKADQSIHITGNSQYIFTPVISLKSESSVKVEINAKNEVKIIGGKTETDGDFEMDIKGEIRARLGDKEDIDIENELNNIDINNLDADL